MPYANFNNQYYLQNLQDMKDRIENQIRNVQQNQIQQQVPQPITQNFQLAPQQNVNTSELESKYAENIDAVKNTIVAKTTLFLTKDYSTLWIKDVAGNIKTFKTEEIIEIDDKDKEIQMLKKEIEDLKGMISNANDTSYSNVDGQSTTKKSSRTSTTTKSNAK